MGRNEEGTLVKKLMMLGASYAVVATLLIFSFHAPVKPVLAAGVLVLILTVARHFTAKR